MKKNKKNIIYNPKSLGYSVNSIYNNQESLNYSVNSIYFIIGIVLIVGLISLITFFKTSSIEKRIKTLEGYFPTPQPTVSLTKDSLKKFFTNDFIHFGDENNKLLIVEVSDPSCPFCHIAGGHNPDLSSQVGDRFKYQSQGGNYIPPLPEIKKLVDQGKASFALIYSNGHGNGELAAQALYCAYEKNKFWEVHDKLMTNDGYNLINDQVKNNPQNISKLVEFLANDIDSQFLSQCLESKKYADKLSRDQQLSPNIGFQGTPHFVINGKLFQGAYSFSDMKSEVDKYL